MIEEIKTLTVLELNELVKALEEEFGVSAAAQVAVVAGAADALQKEYNKQMKARAYYEEYYSQYYCEKEMLFSKPNEIIPINKISEEKTPYIVDFVCRRENGSYVTPRTMQHVSYIIHTQLNFPKYDTHSLSHTHGTMLLENGADFVYIQRRLGHKDLKTTIEIYTNHLTETIKERGNITLNSLYKS